ncbi:hypothetical protein [Micromonospora sp. B9E7]|uniref:hypothetical protein n=1 Tax=Micromonospora sp. B9E7 TaxID=3153574 RepID=UPI00325CD6E2
MLAPSLTAETLVRALRLAAPSPARGGDSRPIDGERSGGRVSASGRDGLRCQAPIRCGGDGSLTIKAPEAIDDVDHLAEHYSRAFRRYAAQAVQIRTFDEFHNAIDDLLAPPHTAGTY